MLREGGTCEEHLSGSEGLREVMVSDWHCDYSWSLCPKAEHTQGQTVSTVQWRMVNVRESFFCWTHTASGGWGGVEEIEESGSSHRRTKNPLGLNLGEASSTVRQVELFSGHHERR